MNIYTTLIFRPLRFAVLMGLAALGGGCAGFVVMAALRIAGVTL